MSTVLDWSRFGWRNIAPERAFEAFTAQLFERWLRRNYADTLATYTLDGAGGDGGVEAFARLSNGTVVGFQAKWFLETIDDSRVAQIRTSIVTACANFSGLRQYVVAIPRNLTKGTPGKGGQPRKGGVERWDELMVEIKAMYPELSIIRWDESSLLEQLAAPGNQELKALWFDGELTMEKLSLAWKKAASRLEQRYLPSLHAVGQFEAAFARDLWTKEWLEEARITIERAALNLQMSASILTDFLRVTEGRREPKLEAAVESVRLAIDALILHGQVLSTTLERGPAVVTSSFPETSALDRMARELEPFKKKEHHLASLGERVLKAAGTAHHRLLNLDRAVRESAYPRLVAGPAGCGKTHAAAQRVHQMVDAGRPGIFLMAKEGDPAQGVGGLLVNALDLPGWPLARLLDGMEALAVLTQIAESVGGKSEGFSRALVIVDGLEESNGWIRWLSMLHELKVEEALRPRLHFVVTARPEAFAKMTLPSGLSRLRLDEDGGISIPKLLTAYCQNYRVNIQAVPWLGWALRTPLEVRLLAEEFADRPIQAADGATLNLLTLFRKKLGRLETEARARAGSNPWSEGLDLVYAVLETLSSLTAESGTWLTHDVTLIERLLVEDSEFTAERVRSTLALLVEYGLVDTWTPSTDGLRSNRPRYGLATKHISDFIVATQCSRMIEKAVSLGGSVKYPRVLLSRPASAVLCAAQLSEAGQHVTDIRWEEPPEDLSALQVAALAYVSLEVARSRTDEVRALLVANTALNRSTLEGLVVPVSRIPGHPLGPVLLDEALRSLPLATRDPIWSVPDDLGGEGPWEGTYSDILDRIELDPAVDGWDGRPLILAWNCSSVKEDRRRRARERLAIWGSRRLDQMVLLVDRMAVVDDPQLVGDIVVAALGAAIGAELTNPALPELARLVDALFFADKARARTPSVIVRAAARGIIERANVMFPRTVDDLLVRSRPPYEHRGPEWPPIDADEAQSSNHSGGDIVSGDLSWYVANGCFDEFSTVATYARYAGHDEIASSLRHAVGEGLVEAPANIREFVVAEREAEERGRVARNDQAADLLAQLRAAYKANAPEGDAEELSEVELLKWAAQQFSLQEVNSGAESLEQQHSDGFKMLLRHAAATLGVKDISPLAVRNGMLAHLVRIWGWSEEKFSHTRFDDPIRTVDHAIVRRHGSGASHGSRSGVCQFREKYVWAAVDWVAGELADRLPVWSRDQHAWMRLTTFDGLGNRMPDPFPYSLENEQPEAEVDAWAPHELLPELFGDEPDPARRAERWLVEAGLPDPVSIVRASVESMADAAVLARSHFRRQHQSCVDQLVQVRAFGVNLKDLELVKRDMRFVGGRMYDSGAWLELGEESAALACWAPWLNWHGTNHGHTSFDDLGRTRAVDIWSLVGSFTTSVHGDVAREQTVWVPSPLLAQGLEIVAMRGGYHLRSYLDRSGTCVALERDLPSSETWSFDDHCLVTDLTGLLQLLKTRELVPIWVVRVLREATPLLFMKGSDKFEVRDGLKHRSRDVTWLVVGGPSNWEAILLSDVLEPWGK